MEINNQKESLLEDIENCCSVIRVEISDNDSFAKPRSHYLEKLYDPDLNKCVDILLQDKQNQSSLFKEMRLITGLTKYELILEKNRRVLNHASKQIKKRVN